MGLFDRGGYRLRDHKKEKKREVRRYKPPRPLSWLGCVLLLFFALLLLFYGGSLLTMRFAGTDVEALANTRLRADGSVEHLELLSQTTNISYTYADSEGKLHQGSDSLIGNEEEFHETIPVRYLPLIPGWSMLRFRTQDLTTPLLCLFLGVVLLCTGVRRLKAIFRPEEAAEHEPEPQPEKTQTS